MWMVTQLIYITTCIVYIITCCVNSAARINQAGYLSPECILKLSLLLLAKSRWYSFYFFNEKTVNKHATPRPNRVFVSSAYRQRERYGPAWWNATDTHIFKDIFRDMFRGKSTGLYFDLVVTTAVHVCSAQCGDIGRVLWFTAGYWCILTVRGI